MRLLACALVVGLALVSAPSIGAAQRDATQLELALIDAWVDSRVASARRAEDAPARAALVASRRTALLTALGEGSTIDLEVVRAEVHARLLDIQSRLDEVGRTCGPVPDTTPARTRRDALVDLERALRDGPFTG